MSALFFTGASGFIGSHLLQRLDISRYDCVYCLSRSQPAGPLKPGVQFVQGSLSDSTSYAPFLARSDTVVHLAAATGKNRREQYFAVNAEGTRFFIDQCEQASVKRFLLVSTIAVKYPDTSHYYYAQSKQMAEEALRRSHLVYCIARPTIVVGTGGSTWRALSRLARLPIPVVFGDGSARIQPIYVLDLVDCLAGILSEDAFSNETFEFGGPETITFGEFIQGIHLHYYGKVSTVIHVPLKPFLILLSWLEDRFSPMLPVNSGQLTVFSSDGTIEPNRIFQRHVSQMKNADAMVSEVIANEK